MTIRIKKDLDRLMGKNLKRMRKERGLSQEQLAEMIDSDCRYISALENGRGIGSSVLTRLCEALKVDEQVFTQMVVGEKQEPYSALSDVTRMLLDELKDMPEYEQLRLLADLKERKALNKEGKNS
jgi:transcriptional regulator with XRE-family HTH domain